MDTIFTKIINGEIPSFKVAENENFYSFLDIRPVAFGHTLVVPKIAIDYVFDLDDTILSEMIVFSKTIAVVLKTLVPCKKIGISVIGLEVPHAHLHLVPINQISDMTFGKSIDVTSNELANLASKLQKLLEN